ncbi:MAG: FtsX-like permease family protein [Gemmatimonadetes bacterium]|nr:FtsX-like permease family protein [Gemmatimonadota bacterium]
MRVPFAISMAWRESRRSRRRLVLYLSSVSLGVAALVAINSFSANVTASVHQQARSLLGADLELRARSGFTQPVVALLDSLARQQVPVSRVTSFASMVLAKRTGRTRLFEVRAIEGGFPYYGTIETDPPGLWSTFRSGRTVVVDPAVLIELDAKAGDTVSVGDGSFAIAGVITSSPGDVGLRTAIGPRVFFPAQFLDETNLLRFGSRAQFRAYLAMPEPGVQHFLNQHNAFFRANGVGYDTVAEQEEDLSDALGRLARYLGLVGLVALLLGGIGVGSAVNVFVKEKLDTAALLRCLGARQPTVLSIYLMQAVALGFIGAAAGVILGILVQIALPAVVEDFLPLTVAISIDWRTVLAGLGIGVATAGLFALLPLLDLKEATPLRALRHEFDSGEATRDPLRFLAYAALLAGILGLSLWQAPRRSIGFAFAGSLLATTLVLWVTAKLLMWATRRFFPSRASYVIRQGVANLFRPQNQTVAVILAIGFGVFLIATLYVVQANLVAQFSMDTSSTRPNLVLFDIQADQRGGVEAMLASRGIKVSQLTPIVPARIWRVNDKAPDEFRPRGDHLPARWALRREYRNTYRDGLVETEKLVTGKWWSGSAGRRVGGSAGDTLPEISLEDQLATDLGVRLGDRITWDVQGVKIETQITSLRKITWARFEPNFFVVFQPGVLEKAPQTFVTLTHSDDPTLRAEVQRDLVITYPNISAVDLTLIQKTLDGVLSKVSLAIRFMALFSVASGLIILIGALAASRFQRVREAVLLKTLGAKGKQIRQILLTEYFAWGSLAAFTGVLLAAIAGWALTTRLFELPFTLPALQLGLVWVVVCLLTTVIGFANSGEVLQKTPLAVLREMSE